MNRESPPEPLKIEPLERFAARFASAHQDITLLDAAIDVHRTFEPDLDESAVRNAVTALVNDAPALTESAGMREAAHALCEYLYADRGFTGNDANYYQPENSYIGQVLRRHTGIPISLAVLYVEVSTARGLKAHGINFPRGYLVGLNRTDERAILDPFTGQVLTLADCRQRLREAEPTAVAQLESYLAPADTISFAVRMLSNLKSVFMNEDRYEEALACCQRILLLAPDSPRDIYDLAVTYEHLGSPDGAIAELRRLRELLTDDTVRRALDRKIKAVNESSRPTLH